MLQRKVLMESAKNDICEVEFEDMAQIQDDYPEPFPKQKKVTAFGREFTLFETKWQCIPATFTGCSTMIAVICAAVAVAGYIFGYTQTDFTYQIAGYVVGAVATVIAAASCLNACGHCVSCCIIENHVSKKGFETNVGKLNLQNNRLALATDVFKENCVGLQQVVVHQREFSQHQQSMTAELKQVLDDKTKQVDKFATALKDTMQKLAEAETAMKNFEDQIKFLNEILEKLSETNQSFKQGLQGLNVAMDGLQHGDGELQHDVQEFDTGNDQYNKLNSDAANLASLLTNEVNLLENYLQAIATQAEKLKEQAVFFDISDDKFVAASENLKKLVQEKQGQIDQISNNLNLANTKMTEMYRLIMNIQDCTQFKQVQESLRHLMESSDSESKDESEE